MERCLDKVDEWEPGTPREEKPIHKAFELFAREFDCYAIIADSYLGRLLSKEFFLPAGDFEKTIPAK